MKLYEWTLVDMNSKKPLFLNLKFPAKNDFIARLKVKRICRKNNYELFSKVPIVMNFWATNLFGIDNNFEYAKVRSYKECLEGTKNGQN